MIPLWMQMKIPRREGREVTLYLPIFIGWILILALSLILFPVWLIATLVARVKGYGWIGFVFVVLLINTLWQLQGLIVDVESEDERIYMKFI